MADAAGPVAEPASRPAPSDRKWVPPCVLFLTLIAVYHANGGFLPSRDALPNLYLPVNLLSRGSLSFAPQESPFMFTWELSGPLGGKTISIDSWDSELLPGVPARQVYESGILKPKPRYFLIPSEKQGRYVNIYGPGAGLTAVPFFALLSIAGAGWRADSGVLGYEGKVFASACVAGSAVLVYLTLSLHLSRAISLGLAFLYGLGTCVWTEPSQALWQQTPALLFVAAGTYGLLRMVEGWKYAAGAGFAYGMAALCRPTLGLLLGAVGLYVLLKDRKKSLLPYAAAGALPVLLLFSYTAWFMGSPVRFGQAQAARKLAMLINGTEDIWQTPLWEGAAGLLLSPSRGLLVFSPFLAFAFWGAIECWRSSLFIPLRAVGLAALALVGVSAKWFEWWGGWCFGYRMIVELTPLWMVFLIPIAGRVFERKPLRFLFAGCAVWAVVVQALGAFAFDPNAWNGRPGFEVREAGKAEGSIFVLEADATKAVASNPAASIARVPMDISSPRFRKRLWSVEDGQIAFLMTPGSLEAGRKTRRWLVSESFKEKTETQVR